MSISPGYRKLRREKLLERSRKGVAARERKRQERIVAGWEPEPNLTRYYPLELGVRDKRTCEVAWIDLRSVRDASKRLRVVLKFLS